MMTSDVVLDTANEPVPCEKSLRPGRYLQTHTYCILYVANLLGYCCVCRFETNQLWEDVILSLYFTGPDDETRIV
jgi:hypothetical protein